MSKAQDLNRIAFNYLERDNYDYIYFEQLYFLKLLQKKVKVNI